jgi:hypothetical protein
MQPTTTLLTPLAMPDTNMDDDIHTISPPALLQFRATRSFNIMPIPEIQHPAAGAIISATSHESLAVITAAARQPFPLSRAHQLS